MRLSSSTLKQLPSLEAIRTERLRREQEKVLDLGSNLSVEDVKQACRSLVSFVKLAWSILHPSVPYVHGWHIELICRHLEAITFGEFIEQGYENRLLINEPPGTMKSLLVNVFWTAWEWGPAKMPWIMNIGTSYRGENCARDCSRTRDLIQSEWYQKLWPLKLTKVGEQHIENIHRGSYRGIPFGSLTQFRADRLKIDDPHSVDTAESDIERARTTLRFRESATTRLNDPKTSAIIIIMQRLHEQDIAGTALALELGYTHLRLPMEYEVDNPCKTPFGEDQRTKEGELLFPARFPRKVVERDKHAMGDHAVAGQFQQRPSSREGGMFKRADFKIVDAIPADCIKNRVRRWDLAATVQRQGKNPDFTASVRMSRCDGKFYIEDVTEFRAEPRKVRNAIISAAASDGKSCKIIIPEDPGQAGKDQAQSIVSENAGYIIKAVRESGDKATRAEPLAAQNGAGNVYLLRAPWNEKFIHQMCAFPAGHDDMFDAASGAFNELTSKPFFTIPKAVLERSKVPSSRLNPIYRNYRRQYS